MMFGEHSTHNEAILDSYFSKAKKPMKAAITKATEAGVPALTIIMWLLTYGPQLYTIIDNLIDIFRKKTTDEVK